MRFSKKFLKAWARNNQRMHDMLLARPPTRYLQRWPDPALERPLPIPISTAALTCKPTRRTVALAKPRPTPPTLAPRNPGIVDPVVLHYQPTQRILELARPALKGKKRSRASSAPKTPKGKKSTYDKERVEILAQRKVTFHPPPEKKTPPKPLSELMPRIKLLCQLPLRYQSPELPTVTMASRLKLEKKEYECPARLKELAQPREYAEFRLDENYDPYLINPAALTYVATDNIKKLAKPKRK